MQIEQINSLLRTIMTLVGAFLTGGGLHYFFGQEINEAYWEQIVGVVLAAAAIYWSIKTKTLDEEKLQGFGRQIVTFICGIFLAQGVLNEKTSNAVISFTGAIIPYLLAGVGRRKSEKVAAGEIKFSELKGVTQEHINKNPYVPENKKTA